MFALVLVIVLAIVIGALWWDRRNGPAGAASVLAAVAGTIACIQMAWGLVEEAKNASLTAPSVLDLALAALLPGAIFAASVAVAATSTWRLAWFTYILAVPLGAGAWIIASEGGSDALGSLAWAGVAWAAGATPSAIRHAQGTLRKWASGLGAAPVAAVAVWSILLFPVMLLTGFTDDFETAPPVISFHVDVEADDAYALRLAWPNSTLGGEAWPALQAALTAQGATWEQDGRAAWFNGTGDRTWEARLLAYPFYEDEGSLAELGPTVASADGINLRLSLTIRPGGCYESLTGAGTVDGDTTIPTEIDGACV